MYKGDKSSMLEVLLDYLEQCIHGGMDDGGPPDGGRWSGGEVFNLTDRNKHLSTGDQQDAAEFTGHILDELMELKEFTFESNDSFSRIGKSGKGIKTMSASNGPGKGAAGKGAAGKTTVNMFRTLFQGRIISALPNNKTYSEPFNILMLYMNGNKDSLEELIENTLETNNSKIDVLPPVLLIQLQRTVYDPHTFCISKNTAPIVLPQLLTINQEWLTDACMAHWDVELLERHSYALKGLVCHYGNFNDGHYTAYAKRGADWFACDDMIISPQVTSKEQYDWQHNSCLLLYEQQFVRPVNPITSIATSQPLPYIFRT
ncbi:ubiquitin carboxyl-terminal hydrolase [Gregarina niphandrodes]|uniref:Ubiquitin carboxyl-terminal hydrolase n=1 Tax=Gregarina niphandrodes TaxID=110365 RepID=A0A023B245_GRENI|nr:ubiquitin carboxyl-terminal hydrolase [Gregarina niphandrodes]EZG48325.1 ubiquitin carboxyl-terminal hydrolase [Gregarina niphandrodes]|eukprot:XP_011132106.1 ubiquitin carboxyl-terminal hydrolase [Gregarina niphandrodes]